MMLNVRRDLGYPRVLGLKGLGKSADVKRWWVVHRAHLHEGLAKIAEKHGAKIHIDSGVKTINFKSNEKVKVTTEAGKRHTLDLLVGSDGVNSET